MLGRLTDEDVVEDPHLIHKGGRGADLPADDLAQDAEEMFFDVLPPEVGRHLDRQPLVLKGDGLDRAEPRLESILLQVVPEDVKTAVPDFNVFFRSHSVQVDFQQQNWGKNCGKKNFFLLFFLKKSQLSKNQDKKFSAFVLC